MKNTPSRTLSRDEIWEDLCKTVAEGVAKHIERILTMTDKEREFLEKLADLMEEYEAQILTLDDDLEMGLWVGRAGKYEYVGMGGTIDADLIHQMLGVSK